jgi:predicted nucleic acid binding AN1-type Zn finger protein
MDTKRCNFCSKKIGIVNTFTCKCEISFCNLHRMPETHECNKMDNFKTDALKRLETQLVKVVAEKVIKC